VDILVTARLVMQVEIASITTDIIISVDATQNRCAGSKKKTADKRLDIDVGYSGCVNAKEFANASEVNCNKQEAVVIEKKSDIDYILIIHNTDGAPEFATSRRILQEIHLYRPSVKIDFLLVEE